MTNWKRPESVPFPSVWSRFVRKGDDGVERTYWIQDLTNEYKEDCLHHVATGFLREENLSKALNMIQDSKSVEEFLKVVNFLLEQKLGLVCLTKNEEGGIQFVAYNITYRSWKGLHADYFAFTGEAIQRFMSVCQYVYDIEDIFTKLNVDSSLGAAGLYVLPQFRGQGIATELLKARRELCIAVGITVSKTLFTSNTAQRAAAMAGFMDSTEVTFGELEKKIPCKWNLAGICKNTQSLKLMYIDYR